jgi:hypothetical protein
MSSEWPPSYHELDQGQSSSSEPLDPTPVPSPLADFLRDERYACLLQATDIGTILIAKMPALEIDSVRGRIPIELRHELHEYPSAPVIRIVTTLYDQPRRPLALETFINVDEPDQRADYAALSHQRELHLFFYDESLRHRLTKQLRNVDLDSIAQVLVEADRIHDAIPRERYDFNLAKQRVIEVTSL